MKPAKSKTPAPHRKTDRRVLRTRDTLGDALFVVMQKKSFNEITVQDLLDRAGVGRSTFYVHYSDKHDLFLSDVEDFFEKFSTALKRQGTSPKRLLPVKELFHAPPRGAGVLRRCGELRKNQRCPRARSRLLSALDR